MFHPGDDIVLRPFVVAPSARWATLPEAVRSTCDHLDPLADPDAPFCLAMNRANCLAYDGTATPGTTRGALGMPLWVMLDCCLLTSVMVGFSAPAQALPPDLRATLDPGGALDHIGISEYIALPSTAPGRVVGVSLFSLARGQGLGHRSKALGLLALGATHLTGVAQYDNVAVRLHLAFGPLRIVTPRAQVHSRPERTFVYETELPPASDLLAMAQGEAVQVPHLAAERWMNPADVDAIAAIVREPGDWAIVDARREQGGAIEALGLARLRP